MSEDNKKEETKKLNPVFEYFRKFRGSLVINDPTLLL